jgi:hypothetical protein
VQQLPDVVEAVVEAVRGVVVGVVEALPLPLALADLALAVAVALVHAIFALPGRREHRHVGVG